MMFSLPWSGRVFGAAGRGNYSLSAVRCGGHPHPGGWRVTPGRERNSLRSQDNRQQSRTLAVSPQLATLAKCSMTEGINRTGNYQGRKDMRAAVGASVAALAWA